MCVSVVLCTHCSCTSRRFSLSLSFLRIYYTENVHFLSFSLYVFSLSLYSTSHAMTRIHSHKSHYECKCIYLSMGRGESRTERCCKWSGSTNISKALIYQVSSYERNSHLLWGEFFRVYENLIHEFDFISSLPFFLYNKGNFKLFSQGKKITLSQ